MIIIWYPQGLMDHHQGTASCTHTQLLSIHLGFPYSVDTFVVTVWVCRRCYEQGVCDHKMFLMLFVLFHWLTIDTPSDTKCLCKWACLCPCFTHFLSWMNLRKCCIESRVEKTHWLKCAFKVAIKVCVCVYVWVGGYVCMCVCVLYRTFLWKGPALFPSPPIEEHFHCNTHIQTQALGSLRERAEVTSYRHPAGYHKNQTSLEKVREREKKRKKCRQKGDRDIEGIMSLSYYTTYNLLHTAHFTQHKFYIRTMQWFC